MNNYSLVRGFNYQPGGGTCSYENWMWFDKERFARELGWGKAAFPSMNTVRLWLSWDAWIRDPQTFCMSFESALQICNALGLRVVACLFNRWHNAFCDNGGIYFDRILPGSDSYDRYFFQDYLESLCAPHRDDERILVWDLCNEPYSHDMPFDVCRPLVEAETNWLIDMDECLREIGVQQDRGFSQHGGLQKAMMQEADKVGTVFMIHPYLQWTPDARAFEERCANVLKHLDWQIAFAKDAGKQVFVTECCWGSIDSLRFRENIERTLSAYRKRDLGFIAHALCQSGVADLHPPVDGPILQDMGQFNFLDKEGRVRPGLEIFNDFC